MTHGGPRLWSLHADRVRGVVVLLLPSSYRTSRYSPISAHICSVTSIKQISQSSTVSAMISSSSYLSSSPGLHHHRDKRTRYILQSVTAANLTSVELGSRRTHVHQTPTPLSNNTLFTTLGSSEKLPFANIPARDSSLSWLLSQLARHKTFSPHPRPESMISCLPTPNENMSWTSAA